MSNLQQSPGVKFAVNIEISCLPALLNALVNSANAYTM